MRQRGDSLDFLLEPGQRRLVGDDFRQQHLDRNLPVQAAIVRPVDHTHAAGAQKILNLVRPYGAAWVGTHRSHGRKPSYEGGSA